MEFEQVKERLDTAIECFYANDKKLLSFKKVKLPERPVSHRLGFYLQFMFEHYIVDCEYNRHLEGLKQIDDKDIIPDVVVHQRKIDENNELVIEVKARRNRRKNRNTAPPTGDNWKLENLTKRVDQGGFGYSWGAYVVFFPDRSYTKWYQNGGPYPREAQATLDRASTDTVLVPANGLP